MTRTAIVAGGTGMVGRQLVRLLAADETWSKLQVIGRRKTGASDTKIEETVVDFETIAAAQLLPATEIFCCLGTTLKQAGSPEAFRKVDYDYVIRLARAGKERGVRRFILMSSMGADPTARVLYSRTKGEIERDVALLGYESLEIIRPSFLVGARDEKRPVERLVVKLLGATAALFAGPLRKYRPIRAERVALAMLKIAKENASGVRVHQSDDLEDRGTT